MKSEAPMSVLVVSDIDETIRIRNVHNLIKSGQNLKHSRHYVGMNSLYRELVQAHSAEIRYVTNSNKVDSHTRFLRESGFPEGQVYFRDKSKDDKQSHKIRIIRRILDENPSDVVLFFGDNTSHDSDTYRTVISERSDDGRIYRTFIRVIDSDGKTVNYEGQIPFLSPIEIALELRDIGIFESDQVRMLTQEVMTTLDRETEYRRSGRKMHKDEFHKGPRVFPGFLECAEYNWEYGDQLDSYSDSRMSVYVERIENLCTGLKVK